MKELRPRIIIGLLFGSSLLLEGGLASGWWPLGWPQPLLLSTVLIAAWWLPLHWHAGLSLGAAIWLDGLQGQSSFPITRLALGMVIVTSLLKASLGRQLNQRQIEWLVAGWLIVLPLIQLLRHGSGLAWPPLLGFCLQAVVGLGLWLWLVRRLGQPTSDHLPRYNGMS